MDHHFLTSYHHAIMSTVLAQFSNQGFLDGMEGMVKLVEASPYLQVCLFNVMVDASAALGLLSESQNNEHSCETVLYCCILCVTHL